MKPGEIIQTLTPERIIALMAEHHTQRKTAIAIGIGRSTLAKLISRNGIKLARSHPKTYGNAAWQALRR